MQKEQYEALKMETVEFDTEDVIRTSPGGGIPQPPPYEPGGDPFGF